MKILKLRNHIPISGPAWREPADGTESDMRVSLGFEPAWFHRRCGINFSEKWHIDPFYRHKSLVKMKKENGKVKVWKEPIPKEWWPDLSKSYDERYAMKYPE